VFAHVQWRVGFFVTLAVATALAACYGVFVLRKRASGS
jgi:hypothetical protein